MNRGKIVGLLEAVSVLFTLWGVLSLVVGAFFGSDFWGNGGVGLFVLALIYGSACILLGNLSLRRADRFRSSGVAFLLLIVRIISFFIAWASVMQIGVGFVSPRASTLRDHLHGVIGGAVSAYLFFRLTVTLTLLNKEKPCETQDLPNITSRSSVNRAHAP